MNMTLKTHGVGKVPRAARVCALVAVLCALSACEGDPGRQWAGKWIPCDGNKGPVIELYDSGARYEMRIDDAGPGFFEYDDVAKEFHVALDGKKYYVRFRPGGIFSFESHEGRSICFRKK
jgi:hypothetical protein